MLWTSLGQFACFRWRYITEADVQVESASLQLQGDQVSLDALTVQQQPVLLQGLEVDGIVVRQRAGPLLREHVDHRVVTIVLQHVRVYIHIGKRTADSNKDGNKNSRGIKRH